jgi:IS1 family transposase
MDETWSYVGKKQRKARDTADRSVTGDQYVFIALDATGKGILSYRFGKRNQPNTVAFVNDLRDRVLGRPEISTDAFNPYHNAIDDAFGADCYYGQIIKTYKAEPPRDAARRYSPGYVVAVSRQAIINEPQHISTSYVERQNLSLRMASRRFTRLTNGFSKKLDNHVAAVGLYVGFYNLCRQHETTRITPAMSLGLTDHIWSIRDLVEAALNEMECGRHVVMDPAKLRIAPETPVPSLAGRFKCTRCGSKQTEAPPEWPGWDG